MLHPPLSRSCCIAGHGCQQLSNPCGAWRRPPLLRMLRRSRDRRPPPPQKTTTRTPAVAGCRSSAAAALPTQPPQPLVRPARSAPRAAQPRPCAQRAPQVGLVTAILSYKCGPQLAALTIGTIAAYTAFTFSVTQWRTQFRCGCGRVCGREGGGGGKLHRAGLLRAAGAAPRLLHAPGARGQCAAPAQPRPHAPSLANKARRLPDPARPGPPRPAPARPGPPAPARAAGSR
jgi:hypothetical protein